MQFGYRLIDHLTHFHVLSKEVRSDLVAPIHPRHMEDGRGRNRWAVQNSTVLATEFARGHVVELMRGVEQRSNPKLL
jgi:hypothetical protein